MAASVHSVRLGKSLLESSSKTYHSLRYNFKPESISCEGQGNLNVASPSADGSSAVHVELPSVNDGKLHYFTGTQHPSKDVECVLTWSDEDQCYVLERLSSVIRLNSSRTKPTPFTKSKPGAITGQSDVYQRSSSAPPKNNKNNNNNNNNNHINHAKRPSGTIDPSELSKTNKKQKRNNNNNDSGPKLSDDQFDIVDDIATSTNNNTNNNNNIVLPKKSASTSPVQDRLSLNNHTAKSSYPSSTYKQPPPAPNPPTPTNPSQSQIANNTSVNTAAASVPPQRTSPLVSPTNGAAYPSSDSDSDSEEDDDDDDDDSDMDIFAATLNESLSRSASAM